MVAANPGPPQPLTLEDAARDDRWIGVSPRVIRWSLDGSGVYFRWHSNPSTDDDSALDPWFWVDREGKAVKEVPWEETTRIPSANVSWSRDGSRAAWVLEGKLYIFDKANQGRTREAVTTEKHCRSPWMSRDGESVFFMIEEDLYRYDVGHGTVRQITRKHTPTPGPKTKVGEWLESQQTDLFEFHRRAKAKKEAADVLVRRRRPYQPQPIPVPPSLFTTP